MQEIDSSATCSLSLTRRSSDLSVKLVATGAITNSGAATLAIDTATNNGNINLSGAHPGETEANALTVSQGTRTLDLTASTGGIYVTQTLGNLLTSKVTTLTASG